MNNYYIAHYFNFENAGIFMLLAFAGLLIVLAIVLAIARMQMHYHLQSEDLSPRRSFTLLRDRCTDSRSRFLLAEISGFLSPAVSSVFRRAKWIPGPRICATAQDLPGSEGLRAPCILVLYRPDPAVYQIHLSR